MVHRRLVYIYLLNVPSFSSRYFNKIKRTSRLGRLLALSLEILWNWELKALQDDSRVQKREHVTMKTSCVLAYLSHLLMVGYCDRLMSVVRRQQLLQMTSPSGFWPNLVRMILIWPFKNSQIVTIHCISRSQRLNRFSRWKLSKSSSLKPQGLELWYLVCSIT